MYHMSGEKAVTDIIFAQTRFDYRNPENGFGSYYDYYRLVELSGFPIVYLDEIDPTDASKCYIFSPVNGEIKDGDRFIGWPNAKAKIVFWNLEQGDYGPIPGVSETWASDKAFADQIGARYVLMGSHPGLMNYDPIPRNGQYDVVMLSYMTPRRQQMAAWLHEKGLTLAPNGWGEDRHRNLMQAQVMLHVHQNNHRYVAPQRWALAAAYKLPVVSETLDNSGELRIFYAPTAQYAELAEYVHIWVKSESEIMRYHGEALHQFLCFDRPFAREVMRNV